MKNDSKYRLDDILVSRGIAANRSKAKAIIMSGIEIGEGAVIGANSVVTKSIEAYSIVAGSPARNIV